jgi:hypothetical protein
MKQCVFGVVVVFVFLLETASHVYHGRQLLAKKYVSYALVFLVFQMVNLSMQLIYCSCFW